MAKARSAPKILYVEVVFENEFDVYTKDELYGEGAEITEDTILYEYHLGPRAKLVLNPESGYMVVAKPKRITKGAKK